ncbi:LysR family transcriptional regulator [Mycolicibacterium smegmatis]|uniref:helix-turn-helix domain-containing protein n=1 Tax=Mycolicibacterium smegmatis TaxID=1772 RepID=UPI0020A27C54|nr:LysR family transcriptional regulator [Mycolicibacterium smegmatis]MCP2621659.1 LysR family transcriptional regulator [Mycolicibacterium smegmatis]MCP2623378.1 LysR family transcriptional regulator [Mycolicibacterium smegmatis]
MRAFVAVVETGRFAAAAERLRLSQPAVSHTIRGLEQRWGVRLLDSSAPGRECAPQRQANCC